MILRRKSCVLLVKNREKSCVLPARGRRPGAVRRPGALLQGDPVKSHWKIGYTTRENHEKHENLKRNDRKFGARTPTRAAISVRKKDYIPHNYNLTHLQRYAP